MNSSKRKKNIPIVTDFDRLRNLFPEIPVVFSKKISVESKWAKRRKIANFAEENIFFEDGGALEFPPEYSKELSPAENEMECSQESVDDSSNDNDNSNESSNDCRNRNTCRNGHGGENKLPFLRISFSELWLLTVKTLVNLTHNCPVACEILMSRNVPCDKGEIKGGDKGENNVMTVCFASLLICYNKKLEIEINDNRTKRKKKKSLINGAYQDRDGVSTNDGGDGGGERVGGEGADVKERISEKEEKEQKEGKEEKDDILDAGSEGGTGSLGSLSPRETPEEVRHS